jgi:hypothetical protein
MIDSANIQRTGTRTLAVIDGGLNNAETNMISTPRTEAARSSAPGDPHAAL